MEYSVVKRYYRDNKTWEVKNKYIIQYLWVCNVRLALSLWLCRFKIRKDYVVKVFWRYTPYKCVKTFYSKIEAIDYVNNMNENIYADEPLNINKNKWKE